MELKMRGLAKQAKNKCQPDSGYHTLPDRVTSDMQKVIQHYLKIQKERQKSSTNVLIKIYKRKISLKYEGKSEDEMFCVQKGAFHFACKM